MWSQARMCDGTYTVQYPSVCPISPCLSIIRMNSSSCKTQWKPVQIGSLESQLKTDTILICELMCANDAVFCAYSVPKLWEIYNVFGASCDLFGLKISTKKTVMLATNGPQPCIKINGELLMIIRQVCYLALQ